MGLGILEDNHLTHVPGTALLADMLDTEQHRYHGLNVLTCATLLVSLMHRDRS